MQILRTPDERFENLPGFAYEPHYTEIAEGKLRVAHVEDGPPAGDVVLCLHGEPSWSYLYRKMLPRFAAAGLRAMAPDLIGFGRSDKPAARTDYTYRRHLDWLTEWLHSQDLNGITLVCQDWGGLLGLRLVAAEPERFRRVVVANTILPTGQGSPSDAFLQWREYSQTTPNFDIGKIVARGCVNPVAPEIVDAYNAPFPDDSYKEGARQFPTLVPITADIAEASENKVAFGVLAQLDIPFLTAFSDGDTIMRGLEKVFQKHLKGCAGQPHTTIENAGHFLQEDQGEKLADVTIAWIQSS